MRSSLRYIRSGAYRTGRSLGDVSALTRGGISSSNVRSAAYDVGRTLGDVQAIAKGDVAGRLFRRGAGRLSGGALGSMFGTSSTVGARLGRRVAGRYAGSGIGRLSSFMFDPSDFFNHLDVKENETMGALGDWLQDAINDLQRISTNIAPILTGDLRKSAKTKVDRDNLEAELVFSVVKVSAHRGPFNYAYWTHEFEYNLGPISALSSGTDGYHVGNKYVERPLKGESKKYEKWMVDKLRGVMD